MYRLEKAEFVQGPYIGLWALLSFQAGFLNAFGFLACGRYISHVTGFGTQIGVALGSKDLAFALELLGFPLSFIAGAWLNGVLTSARIDRAESPRYDWVVLMQPAILFFLVLLGEGGIFGPIGEPVSGVPDFFLLFLLSFTCGLQNACFATLTKGQIRTTHLTGVSTDLGTDLARVMFGRLAPSEHRITLKSNLLRMTTLLSFSGGSIISVLAGKSLQYMALGVPFLTSCFVFVAVRQISARLDEEFDGHPEVIKTRMELRSYSA